MGLSESLPVTSYIKMIDIWMLFTMTLPFLEVVLYTTSEVFKQPKTNQLGPDKLAVVVKSAEEEPKMCNSKSSTIIRLTVCLLPIGSLIFTLIFWLVGLIVSYYSAATQDPNMIDCLTNNVN